MEFMGFWEDKVIKGVESGQNQASAGSQLQETTWFVPQKFHIFSWGHFRRGKDRGRRFTMPLISPLLIAALDPAVFPTSLNEIIWKKVKTIMPPG